MWASVFQGATGGRDYVRQWHESYVNAYEQGLAAASCEPNDIYNEELRSVQEVPDVTVRHYFLLDRADPPRTSSTRWCDDCSAWTSTCTG